MRVPRRPGARPGTREQIVTLLRRSPFTARELASRLGLTHNAVRDHLAVLQREGLIREGGLRRGVSRPAVVYEIDPGEDAVFSRAYIPFARHLMRVLRGRLPQKDLDALMRTVGRSLAAESPRLGGELPRRVEGAAALLAELGSLSDVERENGSYIIRGHGCPLATLTQGRREVCLAMESLLEDLLEVSVKECCDRDGERPRCCFTITGHSGGARRKRRARE